MLAWMLYDGMVALLLGCAAAMGEHAARSVRAPVRWLWCTSLAASALVPLLISSVSIQLPDVAGGGGPLHVGETIALRQTTLPMLAPATWLTQALGPAYGAGAVDFWLGRAWLALSGGLGLALLAGAAHLARRRRTWRPHVMAGTDLVMAEDAGPAVIGVRRPVIVVPRWLHDLPASQQVLILAHEASHLDAQDTRLLAAALTLLVIMPWNLPLWWQVRRLRQAIELDCDARVLRRSPDVALYVETLIAVGARRAGRGALSTCMWAGPSTLEKRITIMLQKKTRYGWALAMALGCSGAMLAAAAAQVTPPNAALPDARSEAALRRLIGGMISGRPDYASMSPELAQLVRDQPQVQAGVASLGPLQSVAFVKSGPHGEDIYTVTQQNGVSQWVIKLNHAGTIVGAVVRAAS